MIEAMKYALEALEMLARYENPETKIQVRKPKDGGPIVTMYPHKVATDAANAIRTAIAEAEVANCDSLSWCKQYNKCHRRVVNAPVLANCITQAEKQEPVAWKNAAIRLGEELSSVGPDGYYNMTAAQWLDWAMDQQPRGKNSLTTPPAAQEPGPVSIKKVAEGHGMTLPTEFVPKRDESKAAIRSLTDQCAALIQERDELQKRVWQYEKLTPPAAQRQPLTDEQIEKMMDEHSAIGWTYWQGVRDAEAAHGIGEKT